MEIKVPDMGVESAEVSEILVSVGDKISKDDNIVLLESDKAAVEVPSTTSGTVDAIKVTLGDKVTEGTVLITLDVSETEEMDSNMSESKHTDNDKTNELAEDVSAKQSSAKTLDDKEDSTDRNTQSTNTVIKSNTYALPDLGVDEAVVAEVMVVVGDQIEKDQAILLVESDKASVEVPAPVTGTVEDLLIKPGDTVKNGQDFISINSKSEPQSARQDSALNNDEINSSKDVKSPNGSGEHSNNNRNNINNNVETQPLTAADTHSGGLSESEVNVKLADVYAGPAVRKLARQLGVDITQVKGSAINDRIVKEDIFVYVKSRMQEIQTHAGSSSQSAMSGLPSLPNMENHEIWGDIEQQQLSRLQKVSIPQLTYNTYLPQVTQFDLSDITETEKLRKALKPEFKAEGIGLTILAFIVKATAYALMQHPKFNSHLGDDNNHIVIRKTVNMGIAVATDDGLIVPVIKNAQNKGIKQIAIEISELAAKARDKKLSTKELQGASFTISSQGNLGGTYFTPLVNWPQVSILGISEASMQPRWNEAKQGFEPRLMLPLSLSYDHRVINGADAAIFTRYIAKLLADPRRILL